MQIVLNQLHKLPPHIHPKVANFRKIHPNTRSKLETPKKSLIINKLSIKGPQQSQYHPHTRDETPLSYMNRP